jgi:hypothetical protein
MPILEPHALSPYIPTSRLQLPMHAFARHGFCPKAYHGPRSRASEVV